MKGCLLGHYNVRGDSLSWDYGTATSINYAFTVGFDERGKLISGGAPTTQPAGGR